jgi:sulfonate dioxygenase
MSSTTTATIASETAPASLSLPVTGQEAEKYKYAHLVPAFPKDEHYPPLTPFNHEDPGHRALQHADPRSFLRDAQVIQLTPPIGEEVRGVNLATLDSDAKDQLALEVR